MAWIAVVTLDQDQNDVGTASATWNAGEVDEFTYSRRAKLTQAEANAFVAEAVAARDARAAKAAQETALTAILQGQFAAL